METKYVIKLNKDETYNPSNRNIYLISTRNGLCQFNTKKYCIIYATYDDALNDLNKCSKELQKACGIRKYKTQRAVSTPESIEVITDLLSKQYISTLTGTQYNDLLSICQWKPLYN